MADEAYPTSEQGERQLSSMTDEQRARYEEALKARQDEAQRESLGSIKTRYGLAKGTVPNMLLPQPVSGEGPNRFPESPVTTRMSSELAERYKQFHSASPGPMRDYFAAEIKKLQDKTGTKGTLGQQMAEARTEQADDALQAYGLPRLAGTPKK
tara:strand:- start:542 stop:1003 length:462 start_codon:yes stop_codon:yes gene_type:complete